MAQAAREGRQAARCPGPPSGGRGAGRLPQAGRARRGEDGALPERRPRGAEADGLGAVAASRPGHDQAAGGGRGSAALDLLPHVAGDGDHGVSVERGDARTRAADRRARIPEDDEALRPDGGHDHGRRDRAHRDLRDWPYALRGYRRSAAPRAVPVALPAAQIHIRKASATIAPASRRAPPSPIRRPRPRSSSPGDARARAADRRARVAEDRVPTRFVSKYTLKPAHLELGGVDLDLAVEDDVLPHRGGPLLAEAGLRGGQIELERAAQKADNELDLTIRGAPDVRASGAAGPRVRARPRP